MQHHNKQPATPQVWQLDLVSLRSVREFAAKWEAEGRPLHVLINNAGIFAMSGAPCDVVC